MNGIHILQLKLRQTDPQIQVEPRMVGHGQSYSYNDVYEVIEWLNEREVGYLSLQRFEVPRA